MSTVDTPSLLARLKAAKRLPSSPGTAIRVLELCRRDDVSLDEIADVLMSDPALAGRVLKFVNSPLAGIGREVSSVRDAVLLLGLRTVKLTALGFSLATPDMQPRCPGFDLKRYWSESFATAVVARRLAQHYAGVDREEAFTVALMGGIGRLALACSIPDQYAKVLEIAHSGEALMQAERVHFGIDNIQFCAELLADWGLPEPLVEAVAYQHQPETATPAGQSLGRILFAASQLAPAFVGDPGLATDARQAARDVVEQTLNLDEESWKPVAEEILGDYLQTASIFEVEFDDQVCILDLYAEAQ